jgi:hypothetical protein
MLEQQYIQTVRLKIISKYPHYKYNKGNPMAMRDLWCRKEKVLVSNTRRKTETEGT